MVVDGGMITAVAISLIPLQIIQKALGPLPHDLLNIPPGSVL